MIQSMAREIMVGMLISASTTKVALAILLSSSWRLSWPDAFTTAKRLWPGA